MKLAMLMLIKPMQLVRKPLALIVLNNRSDNVQVDNSVLFTLQTETQIPCKEAYKLVYNLLWFIKYMYTVYTVNFFKHIVYC